MFGMCGSGMSADQKYPIPSAFFFCQALCYFVYRLLDECDGKQARKTGNSSALGLFLDHGVDAFSVGFQGMIHAKTMQLGSSIFDFSALAIISLIFHVNTAEEYYSGTLVLQELNGVTDGSVILYSILVIAGVYGTDIFLTPVMYGWKVNDIFNLFVIVSQGGMTIYTIKGIVDYQKKER